jgi:hypothetical protein
MIEYTGITIKELTGEYTNRVQYWNSALVFDDENPAIQLSSFDKYKVLPLSEPLSDFENGEISFSSRGVQYRMTVERASDDSVNPSDEMRD